MSFYCSVRKYVAFFSLLKIMTKTSVFWEILFETAALGKSKADFSHHIVTVRTEQTYRKGNADDDTYSFIFNELFIYYILNNLRDL